MACLFHSGESYRRRRGSTLVLALFWISGILSGVAAFCFAGNPLLPMMRGILDGSVSIVGLLCVTVFPFLVSAFAVYICAPWLLFAVSFLKGFLFGFLSAAILVAFGSAGWLIRWFLMFSELVSLPLLYWFWVRNISGERGFSGAEVLVILSLLILIGSVDYCCISPFLAMLINS